MNKIVKIFLFFLLTACATSKTTQTGEEGDNLNKIDTVGIDTELNKEQIPEEDLGEQEESTEVGHKEIVSGFYFAPGMYRTFKILGTLKALDRANKLPNYLSGSEWGAIIALYLGKNGAVNLTEWDMFELLRKVEDEIPYSSDWKKIVLSKLMEDFSNMKFEDFKIKVYLPVWSKSKGVQLISSGPVVDILPSLFHSKTMSCESICSVLQAKEINLSALKAKYPGYWVMFDYLPPVLLEKVQGFEMGLFKITETKIQKNQKYFDLIYRDSKDKLEMDEEKNAHDFLRRGETLGQDFLLKLRSAQKTWLKKKNL